MHSPHADLYLHSTLEIEQYSCRFLFVLGYQLINRSLCPQYRLVKEALHERANLLAIAPHLSAPLPIMLPVYRQVYSKGSEEGELPYKSDR